MKVFVDGIVQGGAITVDFDDVIVEAV